jgi:hypothetical protein
MYCYVGSVPNARELCMNTELVQPDLHANVQGPPIEKLIHLALPVRLTYMQNGERSSLELACTYDIHPRGARLLSARDVKLGDLVTVERGRTKSLCRVVWAADANSALRGQFTVQCIEGAKVPWDEELRQLEEQYLPIIPGDAKSKFRSNSVRMGEKNRRRRPRYAVKGDADLEVGGCSHFEGRLEQISEYGCLVNASEVFDPGTGLRLILNLCNVSVALRGHVRYTSQNHAMGVEFQEIRQGDRPLLEYVLNRLKRPRTEDFADLEVITEVTRTAR